MEPVMRNKFLLPCFGVSCLLLICAVRDVSARQNVIHAGISGGYEYQERDYDNADSAAEEAGVIILDNRLGDERNYILSPRVSFSSAGQNDLFQFTLAPALNYDDLYSTTDVDWDFRLLEENHLTRNWLLTISDSYFLGDDPAREDALQTQEIVPGTIRVRELEVVGSPAEDNSELLTNRFGRTRFWTNNFTVSTEHTYAERSTAGLGYTYSVLRNDGNVNVYSEYDRHDIFASINHRFNATWVLETGGTYSKGLFDENQRTVPVNAVAGVRGENEDLEEYQFQSRLNFIKTPHLRYFGEYRYIGTDFESNAEEDYNLHEFLIGLDYDLSPHLSITVSGGPVIGTFDNSPSDTDYIAYAGVDWNVEHGEFTLGVEKGYEQNDFDGRNSGLTDYWATNAVYTHQFTERLQGALSAEYSNYDRLQVLGTTPAVDQSPDFGQTLYTEKTYSAGALLSYSFARWYQVSAGYRYTKNESDLRNDIEGNYNDNEFFVELSWGKELFRW